jgi:hypothetical protein
MKTCGGLAKRIPLLAVKRFRTVCSQFEMRQIRQRSSDGASDSVAEKATFDFSPIYDD